MLVLSSLYLSMTFFIYLKYYSLLKWINDEPCSINLFYYPKTNSILNRQQGRISRSKDTIPISNQLVTSIKYNQPYSGGTAQVPWNQNTKRIHNNHLELIRPLGLLSTYNRGNQRNKHLLLPICIWWTEEGISVDMPIFMICRNATYNHMYQRD